jgi:thiaminase/transcriptional activator TenA
MPARFTARLRTLAAPVWQAQHEHPFVRGIGDGTLAPVKFKFWVKQDYLYLIDYARLFSLGAARAPGLADMTRLAQLAHETLHTEMALHRAYAKSMGITAAALKRETKAPTCQAYTDFLLRTAAIGSYGELVAALLPCMWGFSEVGQRLAARGMPPSGPYREWVEMYASKDFAQLAAWCCDVVDAAAKGAPPTELRRMEQSFLTSSRYELQFWEMGWTQERWQK